MCTKRSAVMAALLAIGASGLALAGGEQRQPQKKKDGPNPLHVKVTAQVPGVIVQFGSAVTGIALGARVEKGHLLVQLDDRLARLDLDTAKARLAATEAEYKAAMALAEESKHRFLTATRLFEQGALAREDKAAAQLTHIKYAGEVQAKEAGMKIAAIDVHRAGMIVELHQLRSPVNGVIRAIYKMRGEGVKALDAVILIEETPPKSEKTP